MLKEWGRALDSIKQGMLFESQLGNNSANSALTASILLSKMNRFAESVEYSNLSIKQAERLLGLSGTSVSIESLRYKGMNKEALMKREKQLTTYAIANHLLAKSLITLKYYREAKVFLNKASKVV